MWLAPLATRRGEGSLTKPLGSDTRYDVWFRAPATSVLGFATVRVSDQTDHHGADRIGVLAARGSPSRRSASENHAFHVGVPATAGDRSAMLVR